MVCKCGVEIPQPRVDALLSMGRKESSIRCISCASSNPEPRKMGFPIRDHKMQGELFISDNEETINTLYVASARAGTGVSAGVKFHTGRK